MYETEYPQGASHKSRALLFDRAGQFICLGRIKPGKSVYHVTVGGTMESGETTEAALARELKEEIDATAVIGRAFLTVLDTTYHVALSLRLGPNPFTGPEFADRSLGRYSITRVPLSKAMNPEFDLQPVLLQDFFRDYGGAVLAEVKRLDGLTHQHR